jgi:PAS domain S-box-containing protein
VSPRSETYTVVVVDDVPEIREILGFVLEESGWFRVVGEAATADDVLRVVRETNPNLILLDLEVDGVRGWEVLPELRSLFPDIAVVVLSSDELAPLRAKVEEHASAVIAKGSSSGRLIPKLLEVLGGGGLHEAGRPGGRGAVAPELVDADAGAWLSALLGAAPDAMIGLTLDGTIVSFNAAAEQLYGYAAAEMLGRSLDVLVPPDRRDELAALLDAARHGTDIWTQQTVRLHRDGRRVDVSLTFTPVVNAQGDVLGALTIARDISAKRHADAALARAITQLDRRNRELARSNEELDSFAAVASHDLAQPLQVAYGFLDMLRSDYADHLPEQGRTWLGSSLSSLERMRELVRDILRYSRSGTGEPDREPVAVADIVDDVLNALAVVLTDRGARVDVGDLPTVVGDRGQLGLVLQNLVANAVKFVPAERSPVVSISGDTRNGDAFISVADNGIGIAEDQRTRVFEMFQRAAGTEFRGSGLGLSIVKKVVVRHGGSVWIDEAPGGGTVVQLRLPAIDPVAHDPNGLET